MSGRLDAFFEFVRRGIIDLWAGSVDWLAAALRSSPPPLALSLARFDDCHSGLDRLWSVHPSPFVPYAAARSWRAAVRSTIGERLHTGTVLVLPGIHQVRRYSIRDQVYRPTGSASATGPAPSSRLRVCRSASNLRGSLDRGSCSPPPNDKENFRTTSARISSRPPFKESSIHLCPLLGARNFSQRRTEIKQELIAGAQAKIHRHGPRTARSRHREGRSAFPSYRAGMEKLLAEELETEKIHYPCSSRKAQVKQQSSRPKPTRCGANGCGSRRPRASHRSARAGRDHESISLPSSRSRLEQRKLELKPIKSRVFAPRGRRSRRAASSRASGSRQKTRGMRRPIDLISVGKAGAGQLEREGVLVTRYPLLIQKTLGGQAVPIRCRSSSHHSCGG